jgi:predicted transcriptional regulator
MPAPEVLDLDQRREAAGISSATLARRAGSDEAVLSRWRTGDASPNLGTLKRYEQALEELIDEKITTLQGLKKETDHG